MFPIIEVSGTSRERGVQYGRSAETQIARTIEYYGEVFQRYARWDWERAKDVALGFIPAIEQFGPKYLEEMRGIAEGAQVDLLDIVAINLRTEIMFAAKARKADATLPRVGECTSFASVSADGAVLGGQNWDWIPQAHDSVVILRAFQDEGPDYITVVEAGLLGKCGLNSAGLAVFTNALISSEDRGEPGVPYHIMLRALLDCETPNDAIAVIHRHARASSANYIVTHRDGLAVDVEARPGNFANTHFLDPDERGLLLHTNHFIHPGFDAVDVGNWLMSDSRLRYQRAHRQMRLSDPYDLKTYEALLADHAGYPNSVCCHPDPRDHVLEQGLTVTSVLVDVTQGRLFVSDGPACGGFEEIPTGLSHAPSTGSRGPAVHDA